MSRNLGRLQDAEKYINEALSHLDGMTERERFATRGVLLPDDRRLPAVREGIRRADRPIRGGRDRAQQAGAVLDEVAGHAGGRRRDAAGGADPAQPRVVPSQSRGVFAITPAISGPRNKRREALQEPNDLATLALAFAQLGQGRLQAATETYQKLDDDQALGARRGRRLAWATWRCTKVVSPMPPGCSRRAPPRTWRPRTPTGAAEVHLARLRAAHAGTHGAARSRLPTRRWRAADAVKIRFLAARNLVEAGAIDRARAAAGDLAAELSAEPQAYGKIIEGEIALKNGDPKAAIKILTEANGVLDTWLGHFDLGRAYLEAGAFLPGRLRVRPLHQAPGRGAVVARGRGAHVRLFPCRATTTRVLPVKA